MGNSKKHPKGLFLLFVTEMWERFSYYGMRALFVLYLVQALQYDKVGSSEIYGSYTGLVYLSGLLGGYIADKYWGNRRSIFLGGLIMALGQFLMFGSAIIYADSMAMAKMFMFFGLGAIILGNGLFKPNISTMVGDLYEPTDKRKDSAFTIFYMGINLGSTIAPIWCGFVGNTGHPEDFKWGFLSAGIGMLISVTIFQLLKNKYLVTPEGLQVGMPPELNKVHIHKEHKETLAEHKKARKRTLYFGFAGVLLFLLMSMNFSASSIAEIFTGTDIVGAFIYSVCIIVPIYIITDNSLTKGERRRIWVLYIIAFFVIFFWGAFEQAGASLTFFAEEQTNRQIGGWEMPASFFQSFNAIFVVLLAPIFVMIWEFLGKHKIEPTSPQKQATGLALLAIGYLVISFGVKDLDPSTKVSMFWLVSLYFLHTMGELCLSPIGLSMVNKLSPFRFASLLMGVWFASTAASNKLAGVLSGFYPEADKAPRSFMGYEIANLNDFFMLFVFMAGIASILLFALSPVLKKMMITDDGEQID